MSKPDNLQYDAELDARGLMCPEPLVLARNRLRTMASGQVLYVIATDPSTERDFRDLCRFMRHELIEQSQSDDIYQYWIRRA